MVDYRLQRHRRSLLRAVLPEVYQSAGDSSCILKMGFGDYPAEYNPSVHGPYDPARYYGKADTPLSQVKLGELLPWIGRRNKSPRAMVAACSRAFWSWQHKYVLPKKGGIAPVFQVIAGSMIFFYAINYGKMVHHRNYKYH